MPSILIADDHIGLREAYEILFIKEGFTVDTAQDGKEALQKANAKNYDLILLDMLMPNMSGMDFLRAFQPLQHPETKVIVFSNVQAEEQIQEAMTLGVKRYLTKAIMPPKEMAAIVRGILQQ